MNCPTGVQCTLGVSEALPCENEIFNQRVGHCVLCGLWFLVTVADHMVLGPVSCPAKMHCTAAIAL